VFDIVGLCAVSGCYGSLGLGCQRHLLFERRLSTLCSHHRQCDAKKGKESQVHPSPWRYNLIEQGSHNKYMFVIIIIYSGVVIINHQSQCFR